MNKHSKRQQKTQAKLKDFVVVTFVEDMDQAREYETLLNVNDIPVTIRKQSDPSAPTGNFAVLVPEDFLDEAHVIIESQDAYDDFYDMTLDDDSEADLDDKLFGDDF